MIDKATIDLRPSENFGTRLVTRRERIGASIADMAEVTNIRPEFIRAIERLDQDALPAIGYTLGYVRTYAKALGMDGRDAVKDYKADIALSKLPLRDAPHVILQRQWRLPRGTISALSVASAALMIGLWYGTQSQAVATPTLVPEIAPQNAALAPALPDMQEGLYTLRATAPSWIQIRGATGQIEVSRIFVAGETWQGATEAGYSVSIRDAGAVELYDGTRSVGPLGERGELVQSLDLSTAAFMSDLPLPRITHEAALPEDDQANP